MGIELTSGEEHIAHIQYIRTYTLP